MKKIKKGEIAVLLIFPFFLSQAGTIFATPAIYDNPRQVVFLNATPMIILALILLRAAV